MSTHTHRTSPAVIALAATFLFSGLVHGGPAFAAYPGGNGKIAYENEDGTDSEIYVMNADGSGQTNIINDPAPPNHADDRDPSWSPDGTKIAFVRGGAAPQGEGHNNVYVMNANGSGRVNLTPGADTSGRPTRASSPPGPRTGRRSPTTTPGRSGSWTPLRGPTRAR
jgi:hypothetical protein